MKSYILESLKVEAILKVQRGKLITPPDTAVTKAAQKIVCRNFQPLTQMEEGSRVGPTT